MRSSVRLRCVDVVAFTMAAGTVATLVGAAAVSKREIAARVKCASNLRQIGTAIALYANENRGAYPRTSYKHDAVPVWGTPYSAENKELGPTPEADPFAGSKASDKAKATKPADNDVTAALFLLLRTQDLVPAVFTCPSTKFKGFDHGGAGHGALEWTNFPGKEGVARHLSYSYQNAYPKADAVAAGFKLNNSVTAEFAVMADMNPGSEALLTLKLDPAVSPKPGETPPELRAANSLNHGGDGQNVLFGDGHVEFVATPFVGVQRDNIYTAGGAEVKGRNDAKAAFAASPVDPNDSILLPTAADIGQKPEGNEDEPLAPVTDVAAAAKQFAGTYDMKVPDGRVATLVLDEKSLTITSGPMTLKYDLKVVGQREKATVIELTAPQTPPAEVEVIVDGATLSFEGSTFLPSPWKRRADK